MSAFTDDDLKRLKDVQREPGNLMYQMTLDQLHALFARLDAAELLAKSAMSHGKSDDCVRCQPYIEAWRKAAGK